MIYRGDLRAQIDAENFRILRRALVRVNRGRGGATPALDIDCGPRIPGKFSAASGFGRKREHDEARCATAFRESHRATPEAMQRAASAENACAQREMGTLLNETRWRLSDSSSFAGSAGAMSTRVGARATESTRGAIDGPLRALQRWGRRQPRRAEFQRRLGGEGRKHRFNQPPVVDG